MNCCFFYGGVVLLLVVKGRWTRAHSKAKRAHCLKYCTSASRPPRQPVIEELLKWAKPETNGTLIYTHPHRGDASMFTAFLLLSSLLLLKEFISDTAPSVWKMILPPRPSSFPSFSMNFTFSRDSSSSRPANLTGPVL